MAMTLGERNNNPGNIVWTGTQLFEGEMGAGEGGFARFDTVEHGIAAIADNLRAYQDHHGLNTVNGIIRRWSTTDQDAYVANVSRALDVDPDSVINVHDALTLRRLVIAIIRQENAGVHYSPDVIDVALGFTQPAAPIEERSTEAPMPDTPSSNPFSGLLDLVGPVASIFNPLAGALISAFTPLAKEKLTKEINRHTDNPAIGAQVADGVIAAAQRITGLLDPVDAVSAARKDPAVMAQIEAAALAHWEQVSSALDKVAQYEQQGWAAEEASKNAAGVRASQLVSIPFWQDRVFLISLLVLLMVGGLAASVVFMPVWTGDNRTMVLQAFLTALAGVLGFWIGTTRSSSAKDVTISQLANK